jgi:hypothetical protein
MSLNASARLAVWLGLIVAMGTAVAIVPASRTSPTWVVPSSAAEAVAADTRPAWQIALETMDRALAAGDISGAEMAWRDAYGLAIRSRQWPALLAAGDGALRIGDRVLLKRPYRARAAEAWRTALFLARAQQSVDGVLQVAEAFARLGDAEGVTQVLRIADGLAATDPSGEARRRVLDARQRLTSPAGTHALADPILTLFPDAAVGP